MGIYIPGMKVPSRVTSAGNVVPTGMAVNLVVAGVAEKRIIRLEHYEKGLPRGFTNSLGQLPITDVQI